VRASLGVHRDTICNLSAFVGNRFVAHYVFWWVTFWQPLPPLWDSSGHFVRTSICRRLFALTVFIDLDFRGRAPGCSCEIVLGALRSVANHLQNAHSPFSHMTAVERETLLPLCEPCRSFQALFVVAIGSMG